MSKLIYKFIFSFIFLLLLTFDCVYSQNQRDLDKIMREYNTLKNSSNQNQLDKRKNNSDDSIFDSKIMFNPYANNFNSSEIDSLSRNNAYFGYNFFTKRDTLQFWENLPAPNNYIVGPGDEIIISLWGQTQLRKKYLITRDGNIYDEQVGVINVSGKTLDQLKQYLIREFGRTYATLRGQKPSTYIDVSLGQLKMINVNFVGELMYPGVHALHPFSNIIFGLIQAGGIDTTGTLRKIKLKRNGEEDRTIDLYNYFITGDIPEKIQLKDQDVVLVPIRSSTVKIDSAVYKPKIYEMIENETPFDIINFAGGLKPQASRKININRLTPFEDRVGDENNYFSFYTDFDQSNEIKIFDGDEITIPIVFKTINKVEVIGQVKRPGKYNFYEGMKLKDLILLAGGLQDTTFIKSIFLNQAELIRKDNSTRYEKIIKIDLTNFHEKEFRNLKLQNLDRLVIHENLNFYERKNIKISGEVNIPGSYPLIRNDETLLSIINRSGGLTPKALPGGISIFRKKLIKTDYQVDSKINIIPNDPIKETLMRVAWTNKNITLIPGDSIVVKEKSNSVTVIGEVYNPGIIEYKKGRRSTYYINASGGLTDNANKNGIIVVYPNGMVSPVSRYNGAKIIDGSQIVVYKKELSEPFNITQFATNWTSIISSMITAIVLSQQIQNN